MNQPTVVMHASGTKNQQWTPQRATLVLAGSQRQPSVAALANGDAAITWFDVDGTGELEGGSGNLTSQAFIQTRRW